MGSEEAVGDINKKGLQQLYFKLLNNSKHLRFLYVLVLLLILVVFFPSSNLSLTRKSKNYTHFVRTMGPTTSRASRSSSTRMYSSLIADATIDPSDIKIIYGTAWKKERSKELVKMAINEGFRVIDTACQPKHYNEKLVGEAVQETIEAGVLKRSDLFIQTKFTSVRGQDPHDMPYNMNSPLEEQVKTSFQTSLEHFATSFIDSLVLHSPMPSIEETIKVWRVFEQLKNEEQVRFLGISNCYDVNNLKALYEAATVKPTFVQNRFYGKSGFDKEIRKYCKEKQIYYQSFWTLTANPGFLKHPNIIQTSHRYDKTPEQILYKFVQSLGIIPLSGTCSVKHMRDDLQLDDFELSPDERNFMKSLVNSEEF